MEIKSKFEGCCKRCSGVIKKGAICNWTSSYGARHIKCNIKKKKR